MPYDYSWDRPCDTLGLARTASLIAAARAESDNSLLFDNGDFLQGNALSDLAAEGGLDGRRTHPVIAAMNALAYDAAALGNHEFSYGLPFLVRALQGARFPVLAANAVRARGPDPLQDLAFVPPVCILNRTLTGDLGQRARLRLGVIGLMPPQAELWEAATLAGRLVTRDILQAARAWVPVLRARGADLVVALCHSGIGPDDPAPGAENAALALASQVGGIDAIIAGHVHQPFPSPEIEARAGVDPVAGALAGVPAVMAGAWGSHLGVIDLTLSRGAAGWAVTNHRAEARPISCRTDDGRVLPLVPNHPAVEVLARPAHLAALARVRAPVGHSDRPMHSYFARFADSAALQLIHEAQLEWLADVARGSAFADLPRLSAASPFKTGGRGGACHFTDIPAGDLALRHIGDLYPFPNAAAAVVVTGARLCEWLERSAAQFQTLVPGRGEQPLLDPDMPSYNVDMLAGLTYLIDVTAPARYDAQGQLIRPGGGRIRDLAWQGRPVLDGMRFLVATNSFRASGGGAYPGLDGRATVAQPLTLNSDLIRSYIARRRTIAPVPRHDWRIAPLPPGTSAWFDTGPDARAHLQDDPALQVEPIGDTADGFLRCRVQF